MQNPSSYLELSKRWKRKKQKERNTQLEIARFNLVSRLHDSEKEPFVKHIMAHTVSLSTPLHTKGNEEEVTIYRKPTRVCEGKLISS